MPGSGLFMLLLIVAALLVPNVRLRARPKRHGGDVGEVERPSDARGASLHE